MKKWLRFLLIILGIIVLLLAVGPFLVPIPPLENTVPVADLIDADSQFVTIPFDGTDGLDIHYKEDGSGDTNFLLLHGFNSNLYAWEAIIDEFAVYGRTVAYDRIPFGLSEKPLADDWSAANPYTTAATVAQAFTLMDTLGMDTAVLVGNSNGGSIALEMARTHPERVTALILAAPDVYTGGGSPIPPWLTRTPQFRHIGPLISRGLAGADLSEQVYADPGIVTADMATKAQISTRVADWDRALWAYTMASAESDLPNFLTTIDIPALVITGDSDGIVNPDDTRRLATELPSAAFVELTACGHVPQQECPAAMMAETAVWLDTQNLASNGR